MEKHIGDFMRIVRCTNYFRTQKMTDSGITGIQCTYLLCINRTPGISQEQLASQLYKDKSVIARHLASLESNGYIHREPDSKDRRVQKLYLTAKAEELLPRIRVYMTVFRMRRSCCSVPCCAGFIRMRNWLLDIRNI